jgi:hypothetical protein
MKRKAAANLALALADDGAPLQNVLRGQLTDRHSIRRYIEGGNAKLTIQSKSGARFTFKFRRPDQESSNAYAMARNTMNAARNTRVPCIWVSVLNGSDNETNYAFIGTIFPDRSTSEIRVSPKSRVSPDADSAKAVSWLLRQVYLGTNDEALFGRASIWHEGSCGRCGRTLTVPESVSSGFGPECIKFVK